MSRFGTARGLYPKIWTRQHSDALYGAIQANQASKEGSIMLENHDYDATTAQPAKRGRGRPKGTTKAAMAQRKAADAKSDVARLLADTDDECRRYRLGEIGWTDLSLGARAVVRKAAMHLAQSRPAPAPYATNRHSWVLPVYDDRNRHVGHACLDCTNGRVHVSDMPAHIHIGLVTRLPAGKQPSGLAEAELQRSDVDLEWLDARAVDTSYRHAKSLAGRPANNVDEVSFVPSGTPADVEEVIGRLDSIAGHFDGTGNVPEAVFMAFFNARANLVSHDVASARRNLATLAKYSKHATVRAVARAVARMLAS